MFELLPSNGPVMTTGFPVWPSGGILNADVFWPGVAAVPGFAASIGITALPNSSDVFVLVGGEGEIPRSDGLKLDRRLVLRAAVMSAPVDVSPPDSGTVSTTGSVEALEFTDLPATGFLHAIA